MDTIAGVDFGYTNPTAMLTILVDSQGNYWITKEFYKTGMTNQDFIEYASSYDINKFYPDPAEPDRIEEMRRACMNVQEVNKDITLGINRVQDLLNSGRIKIHKDCLSLIMEMEMYVWDENKLPKEVPIKSNDHAMDALRYALFMHSSRCLLYTSPSPRDGLLSRMPSSA